MNGFNIEINDIDNITTREYDLCFSVVLAFQRQSKIGFKKSTSDINGIHRIRMTKREFLDFLDTTSRKIKGADKYARLRNALNASEFSFLDEIDIHFLKKLRNCGHVTRCYFGEILEHLRKDNKTKNVEINKSIYYLISM